LEFLPSRTDLLRIEVGFAIDVLSSREQRSAIRANNFFRFVKDMMKFNLFSSREAAPVATAADAGLGVPGHDIERECLTVALHSLLETLPQSYSGRENIKLLCHAIVSATSHLRFVWVGFCEGDAERISPYASAGEAALECNDWQLSRKCFDPVGPYSQKFPQGAMATAEAESLYAPWREGTETSSVRCALAIPLRSEKRATRGLVVFYADAQNYFRQLGVPMFQAFCHVAEIIWKQSNLMHMLTQKAQQDPLTGLMNRRQTMQTLDQAILHAEHSQAPLSVLICRIEGFNKINDLYGWSASDAILAAFCKETVAQMRVHHKGGRWTGTEFLFILPQTGPGESELLAKRLREHFLVHPISVESWSVRLALSVGAATYSQDIIGADDFILHASQSMSVATDEVQQSYVMHMLAEKAQQDPLTGLMNRRHTMHVLERSMADAAQLGEPLSILICRVDDFSKLNDVYGWLASDAILAAFCKEMAEQMRPEDKGGRWTGVEFLFVLPRTEVEQAQALARSLRDYFLLHPVSVKSWSIRLPLSFGVAAYSKNMVGLDDFILHANQNTLRGEDELPSSIL
jgi:diguanylate cyclase (GGDEF)-like protein